MFSLTIFSLLTISGIGVSPFSPATAFAEGRVTVTPDKVNPGENVTVAGSGWAPHDQILVSFADPSGAVLPLGIIAADANGAFQKVINVPSTVPPGTYQIDGNGQGGAVAVALTILAPPIAAVPPTQTSSPPSVTPSETQSTRQTTRSPTMTSTMTSTITPSATPSPTTTPTSTTTSTATPTLTPTPSATSTQTPTLPERIINADGGTGVTAFLALLPFLGIAAYLIWRRRQL
jgi:hypothetical protein